MNTQQASGIRRVVADFMELVELQFRLFGIDGKEAMRRVLFALAMAGLAGAIAISSMTVGLLGFGWVLHALAGWPVGVSLLVVAAVAVVIMLALLVGAYASLRRAVSAMKESGAEFAENLRWFRESLRSEEDSAPPRYTGAVPEAAGRSRF